MLRCIHHRERGVDLAVIEGRFVQNDGVETRKFLLFLAATGSGRLVLDLARATYMDSYGLATLVLVQKAMCGRKGRLVLAAIPPDLQALIALTRIQSLFEIFAGQDTAIANLSSASSEAGSGTGTPRNPARFESATRPD